jgi:hypothetical protein
VFDTPGWTDKSTLTLARQLTLTAIPTGPDAGIAHVERRVGQVNCVRYLMAVDSLFRRR